MRNLALVALLVVGLSFAVGCQSQPPGVNWEASEGGLTVQVNLPARNFYVGQTISMKITAINTTDAPMPINGDSKAPVIVSLYRQTAAGWELVKRYPESPVMVANNWTLAPKSNREFPLSLVVSPDWPTGEAIRLEGTVNGKPNIKPGGVIQVFATKAECNRALIY